MSAPTKYPKKKPATRYETTSEDVESRHGLFRSVPRYLKTLVAGRMAALEADRDAFDRAALLDRAAMKRLYALLHLAPGPRAQGTLFERPPAESPVAALAKLVRTPGARQAAALVRAHRLPFLLVESALGKLEPEVALALMETMDDAELLDRLRLFARRKLLVGPVRAALAVRLRSMRGAPPAGLSYRKAESIARLAELDAALSDALFALVEVRGARALAGATALLVDVSPSVAAARGAFELAAHVGAELDAALPDAEVLRVVAFGAMACEVQVPRRSDVRAWRDALATQPGALGTGTSVGAAVSALGDEVDLARIVVVTDGYENRPPRLTAALAARAARTRARPAVCLVQPPDGARQLAVDLRNASQPFEVFVADAHGAGMDALVPALAGAAGDDLLGAIASFPLPG